MRLVLAHAGAGLKGLQCGGADAGAVFAVAHSLSHRLAQGQQLPDSARAGQRRLNKAPAEICQPRCGCSQRRGPQKETGVRHVRGIGKLRHAQCVHLPGRIDYAPANIDARLRYKGVRMHAVAVRIVLREQLFGRTQAPEMNRLRGPALRRQPHGLDGVTQRFAVAVVGGVLDVQLHGAHLNSKSWQQTG